MNFADDAEFAAFMGSYDVPSVVTPQAVARALAGFPLVLSPGRDMEWLSMAVRRSLAISSTGDSPERTSNVEIRRALERLATLAGSTWLELFQCDDAVDSRLWDHAYHNWDSENGTDVYDGIGMGKPINYIRFTAAVRELDWIASFMRDAARATASQRGPWRQSEGKRIRVERGQYLARIYEAAFGKLVSANNYPNDDRHTVPTPFMVFYERMVTLAYGARETTNLAEVVKAACQLHRRQPAQFGEGMIPGM